MDKYLKLKYMTDLLPNIPDQEGLKVLVYVIGSIIGTLLAVISYFLKKQIVIQERLTDAVNLLTTTVTVLKSHNDDKFPIIDKKIDNLENAVDDHGRKIAVLESKADRNK